jgi:peroxiredoxin
MSKIMNVKSIFLWTLCCSILILSCKRDKNQGKNVTTITGKFSNLKQQTIYLEKLSPVAIVIADSAVTDEEGNFMLDEQIDEMAFYRVRYKEDFLTLLLEKGENIHITGDASNLMESYVVVGSPASSLLKSFNSVMIKSDQSMDSLQKEYSQVRPGAENASTEAQEKMRNAFEQLEKKKNAFVRQFVEKNSNAMVLLAAISYLSTDTSFSYYLKTDSLLLKQFPKSLYTKDFHAHVEKLRKLAVGAKAPEINLSSPDGKQIKLSSFKGKIVLLDFWASWCAPCRKESPNLVKIYQKFHPKGLEIYSVSLDKDKAAWLKAIADDRLNWVHVSDLKFWDGAAVKSYEIQSIPFTLILDENGMIAGKALRGQDLEARMDALFSKHQ